MIARRYKSDAGKLVGHESSSKSLSESPGNPGDVQISSTDSHLEAGVAETVPPQIHFGRGARRLGGRSGVDEASWVGVSRTKVGHQASRIHGSQVKDVPMGGTPPQDYWQGRA